MIPMPCAANRGPVFIRPTVIGTKKNAKCLIKNEPAGSSHDSLMTPSASNA